MREIYVKGTHERGDLCEKRMCVGEGCEKDVGRMGEGTV